MTKKARESLVRTSKYALKLTDSFFWAVRYSTQFFSRTQNSSYGSKSSSNWKRGKNLRCTQSTYALPSFAYVCESIDDLKGIDSFSRFLTLRQQRQTKFSKRIFNYFDPVLSPRPPWALAVSPKTTCSTSRRRQCCRTIPPSQSSQQKKTRLRDPQFSEAKRKAAILHPEISRASTPASTRRRPRERLSTPTYTTPRSTTIPISPPGDRTRVSTCFPRLTRGPSKSPTTQRRQTFERLFSRKTFSLSRTHSRLFASSQIDFLPIVTRKSVDGEEFELIGERSPSLSQLNVITMGDDDGTKKRTWLEKPDPSIA